MGNNEFKPDLQQETFSSSRLVHRFKATKNGHDLTYHTGVDIDIDRLLAVPFYLNISLLIDINANCVSTARANFEAGAKQK